MTSDDPAPISPSVFQSSRAALHQDATKSPELVPRLSRSAREFEVAGVDTRLEPAGRNFDPILQHCTRHFVGFIGDLEEASPVCFWENVVAQVDLLFVVKKTGSSSMHEPAVFGTPFGPMLSVKSLCHISMYWSFCIWSVLTCWLCGCQERRPPTAQSLLVAGTLHCSQR